MKLTFDKNLTALILLAAFLFLFRLGDRPLRNPDEGRYAEVAREMVVSGDWLEPTLLGVDYLRKPVLFYWLIASSFTVFGTHEFAARLVPALFGLFGIAAAAVFAARYWGRRTAEWSAAILATNPLYWGVSRYLVIDVVFSFFLLAAFYCFYTALHGGRRRFLYGFFLSAALAFLAKGVAVLAILAFTLPAYVWVAGRAREGFRILFSPAGILLFLAVAAPWYVAIARHEPEFMKFFFLHEHVARFMSKNFEHQQPWFYYLALLPAVSSPWILVPGPLKVLARSVRRSAGDKCFYLTVVAAGTLVFYTLSRTKLVTYMLPVIPPLSILLADAWVSWAGSHPGRRRLFVVSAGLLACACAVLPFVFESVNRNYTTRHLAEKLAPALRPEDVVYIYGQPGAFYDFPFYLKRPMRLVGFEGELEFDKDDRWTEEHEAEAVVDHAAWIQALSTGRSYTLMRASDYDGLEPALRERLRVVDRDKRKVLLQAP